MNDVELYIVRTAKGHDQETLQLLHTIPGVGKVLALVLLYEIQDISRFPSVQDFVSYCRHGGDEGSDGAVVGNLPAG